MALTKAEIIESVQQQLGFPKKMSNEVVEQLIETIKSTLASGEDVLVSGFGKFCVNTDFRGAVSYNGFRPVVSPSVNKNNENSVR